MVALSKLPREKVKELNNGRYLTKAYAIQLLKERGKTGRHFKTHDEVIEYLRSIYTPAVVTPSKVPKKKKAKKVKAPEVVPLEPEHLPANDRVTQYKNFTEEYLVAVKINNKWAKSMLLALTNAKNLESFRDKFEMLIRARPDDKQIRDFSLAIQSQFEEAYDDLYV